MPIALLIALLMGGTVSYAAEGTLPGDTLYPVKIHVNEKVQSAITVSPSAQAELEIRLAEKRLREAEALHGEGRLDAQAKSELRGRFDEHSGRAKAEIESFSEEDKEEAARIRTDLKIKFGQHGDVLRVLEIEIEDEDGDDRQESQGDDDNRFTITSDGSITTRGEDREDEQEIERHESRSESDEDDSRRGDDEGDDDEDEDGWDDDVRVDVTTGVGISMPTVGTTPAPSPAPAVTPAPATSAKTFTLAEIATHSNAASCYTAVSGSVYDVTSYIPIHKGGMAAILGICGKDGTIFFSAQHTGQPKPETMLASFKIGTLAP